MIEDKAKKREIIAKRAALELKDEDLVNLGIGIPTLVANYISENIKVFFHSENGIVGMGRSVDENEADPDMTNAGGQPVTYIKGAAAIDSALSFAIIRGGHLDVTILGALQVDEKGHLANWKIPGKFVPGMGGAMDLVTGAKKVIVVMTHTTKGKPKIVPECTLPLTSIRKVDLVVTEMCVIKPTDEGLVLKELAPSTTIKEVTENTDAKLIIPDEVPVMNV
ncbi:MAG: 3-oxoacid CoA-transferase subunit B [Kosmotogaceae bacterium]